MARVGAAVYADALFEVALKADCVGKMAEEAAMVRDLLTGESEYLKLLCHPGIDTEEKKQLIREAFAGRVSEDLLSFLLQVLDKNRQKELPQMFDLFLDQVREFQKRGKAVVISAVPLREEQKARIEERLIATTSYESFEMEYQVDEKVLGGMVIRLKDRVVDSTIRTKLDSMARYLAQMQLPREASGQ